MDRSTVISYLEHSLGQGRVTSQGVKFCCPKGCDSTHSKYNLEINLAKSSSKYLLFHAWCCHYKGHIKYLFKEYASDKSWMSIPELWKKSNYQTDLTTIKIEKELPKTIPYYLSEQVEFYLKEIRNLTDEVLQEHQVLYCYSESEEQFYNKIIFPFYENNKFIGFSTHDLKTKRYSNQRSLNFVPYKDLINVNYPIIITEGIYDAYSVPNAIPLLGTKPSKELYKFCKDKKIILCLDKEVPIEEKNKIADTFKFYGCELIVIFDLKDYKDLNEYRVKDPQGLRSEIKGIFDLLNF